MIKPALFCLVLFCWQLDKEHLPSASNGATFCQIYQPQYISPKDTRKTKEQADALNRVWKELCASEKK